MLKVGDEVPEFELPDQDSTLRTSQEFKGKKVLIYFYPKDDTPGCTAEACGFRDLRHQLSDKGVVVIGISKDSVKSHKKFVEKYELPFILLSDESVETIKAYQAWGKKKFMGREYEGILRISYLVDEQGKVEKVYGTVDTKKHAEEILADVG